MATFCLIDDKHVPLYRILWISAIPHFCGSPDCQHEGEYEVRLEQGESVWANQLERDQTVSAIEAWQTAPGLDDEEID
ncbi:MAG TPA: hypothetical protein VJL29_08570 [Thermoguttaceae bacterium]|nr:hypothetical protein [Thermoguttaceae bacterium]